VHPQFLYLLKEEIISVKAPLKTSHEITEKNLFFKVLQVRDNYKFFEKKVLEFYSRKDLESLLIPNF
jgi:hypothetical protein